jgi:hypothetical protein
MILQETDFASPTSMLRARAAIYGKTKPGTVTGELLRSGMQFKSFAVMWGMLHMERALREMVVNGLKGASYAGMVLATMAVGGALVVQLKNMIGMKEPEPMDTPKFWGRAFVQGGGLGIWGDLLASESNRFGGGILSTFGGPAFGIAEDILRPTVGAALQRSQGKHPPIGADVSKLLTGYIPGTSLWYTRQIWQRLVADGLQQVLDPDAHKSFRMKIEKQRHDYGNGFWWRPGQPVPDSMR